jgi:hypothetical protein
VVGSSQPTSDVQAAPRLVVRPLEREGRPVAERATTTSEFSAAFTASFVGKTLESSGVKTTRLLPFLNSWKCFPRTPLPRSSRRYSARIGLVFFIDRFVPGRQTTTDDAVPPASEGVDNGEDTRALRLPKHQPSVLTDRMVGIRERERQWVSKNRGCLFEVHSVLLEIHRGLFGVDLEVHAALFHAEDCTERLGWR